MSRYLLIISFILVIPPLVPISSAEAENQEHSVSPKEASSGSKNENDMGPMHYNRLYDAYRERLKGEEGDDTEDEEKIDSKDAPLQRDVIALTKKSSQPLAAEKDSTELPIIKYDATDDRPMPSGKCLARLPYRNMGNQSVKAKVERKTPLVSSMILLKLDVPENVLRVKTPQNAQDPGERRIFELNRIYKDFLKAWQQPTPSLASKSENPTKPMSSSGSVRLSALSDLMDVIERLQKSDLVKELAEKISEEMEPNLQNQIKQDALLVTESRASLRAIKKNDLSGIFENEEPGSASKAFKRLLDDINSRRSTIKAGGLYDEYKKGFCQLFSDHKFPRQSLITSEADYPLDSESSRRINGEDNFPSQSDKTKATSFKSIEPEIRTPSKICVSVATPSTNNNNNNYMRALETFIKLNKESNKNGGLKPYYLPNSKNRQLIWNDIPLIKPGLSETPKKTSESKPKYKPSSTPIQENVVPEKEPNKVVTSKPDPKLETKFIGCVPKIETKAQSINPWQEVFSGMDPKQIISGLKAIKQSSFFNLVDEYQKQIDNLNQALKTKQSWWKEVLERGKSPLGTPAKRNILMGNSPSGAPLPAPFPEVLVNQAPPQLMGGGNNVIDNMATQMNLSPVELAQRIVGGGQNSAIADGRVKLVQNHLQPASQIGSSFKRGPEVLCQVPCQSMGQPSHPQQPQQQQQQQQEEQMGISPVLDKILQRLENIQETKCNKSAEEEEEKNLPCCFVDPADGSPCDLNGSWESLVLGVRINIKAPPMTADGEEKARPSCSQHKGGRAHHRRFVRQCVKMNKTQLKDIAEAKAPNFQGVSLNISVQETVPPRDHELLDNLTDWHFSGHALMVLGGPLSLSFRKANSNLIGHFIGYCRTCGCVDTIFGSWSFCQPSRDCQDICMSIVDRRDMLRRYSMDERRKNRFKELLYTGSKFAKMEKDRLLAEQEKYQKLRSQASSETDASIPSSKSQSCPKI